MGTRQHIVPIKDRERIQKYALKLAMEGKLQYAILVNVATQLHQALKTNIFQQIGPQKSPYEDFKITPKLVAHLEKKFENFFTSDFWEKNAEWIMNHLISGIRERPIQTSSRECWLFLLTPLSQNQNPGQNPR